MRVIQRSDSWLTRLALFLAVAPDAHCAVAEPQAAFLVKQGWVELALKQEGRPVADAVIEVIDEKGAKFAEGETDHDGQAIFPFPPGASCRVEIKIKDRTADSIRLFKTDEGIQPARVLLSYGLRSCCRFKTTREIIVAGEPTEAPPVLADSLPIGFFLGAALAGLFSAAAICFVVKRQRSPHGTNLSPEDDRNYG